MADYWRCPDEIDRLAREIIETHHPHLKENEMSFITRPMQVVGKLGTGNNRSGRATLSVMVAVVGVLGFSSTGWCSGDMLAPSDGDEIGLFLTDEVTFDGYTTTPGATVKIQARNIFGNWVTIATTTSSTSGWPGFYSWSKTAYVPSQFWSYCCYYSIYEADVRAIRVSGWYSIQLGDPITIYFWNGGPS